MPESEEELGSLRQEVLTLRTRVGELQRRVASFREGEQRANFSGLEVSISEREELLAEAERISHVGSWVWDVERNGVFWSHELFRILGYDPELDTPSVEAFNARVHPDDLERVQARAAEIARGGEARRTEHRIQWPDGSVRYVTTDGALLFDDAGSVRRIVGTVLDQTEPRSAALALRRANELLEQAQELARLGSFSLVLSSGKREWSREFYRIMGIDPSQAPSRELFLAHVHPEDRTRLVETHERAIQDRRTGEVEGRVVRASGEVRYVRVKSLPLFDSRGNLEEVRGTVLDITEQVELRERLAHAQKVEAIGRLAGGIAHDFNNLLTVISGNLGLLAASAESPIEEVEESLRAVNSAQALTLRLLAFGRKARLDRRVIDPNELVRSTLALLSRVIGDQIQLGAELDEGVGRIEVDPAQLEQCLINLVNNARDAMAGAGSIQLGTRVLLDAERREWVEITVRDNGPGIDETTRRSIFEPFFTTKPEGRGTGLGLAMVLGTVEQHGGQVHVESELGKGTTFRLRLPRVHGTATALHDQAGVIPETPSGAATILVVEDQAMVARVIARTLKKMGHRVLVAAGPSEAMAIFDAEPRIGLVVCDVMMSEMRGPALIEVLETRQRPFEVLFVTGYSEEMLEHAPKHEVLAKPFTPEALRARVTALLARRGQTSPGGFG